MKKTKVLNTKFNMLYYLIIPFMSLDNILFNKNFVYSLMYTFIPLGVVGAHAFYSIDKLVYYYKIDSMFSKHEIYKILNNHAKISRLKKLEPTNEIVILLSKFSNQFQVWWTISVISFFVLLVMI